MELKFMQMKNIKLKDSFVKGTGVTTRRMRAQSQLKMLEFDCMIDPEGTCNQQKLLDARVKEPKALERGEVQEGLIHSCCTA